MTPRAVFIDREPTCIDEIRTGPYRNLYDPDLLIAGNEEADKNFARGRYTIGSKIIELCLDRIRKLTELCEDLDGFMIYHSVGGGTGSGFGSLLLERLSADYGKKTKLGFTVYPSPTTQTSTIEPYNAVLTNRYLTEHTNTVFVLENSALQDICRKKLQLKRPTHTSVNTLLAQVISSITLAMRFEGNLNMALGEFEKNLVPYPRIHFLMAGYSPFLPRNCEK